MHSVWLKGTYLCCPLHSTAMWYSYLGQLILTSFPYLQWTSGPMTMTILEHPVAVVRQPLRSFWPWTHYQDSFFTNTVTETTFWCLAKFCCVMSGLTLRSQTGRSQWEWRHSPVWIWLWFSSIKPWNFWQFPVTSSPGGPSLAGNLPSRFIPVHQYHSLQCDIKYLIESSNHAEWCLKLCKIM